MTKPPDKSKVVRKLRCAVYTRKSSEEGLEQEFNSLHAMFFFGKRREGSESAALGWMSKTFNEEYPKKGMLFCVGNMAKRPQTWQLLGVLRVDDTRQDTLPL